VIESLVVLGGLACLIGLAALVASLPTLTSLWIALGLVLTGMALGGPFGVLYHLKLRRELRLLGELPKRWYLHPTRLHRVLSDEAMRRIGPAFALGALGFGLMMLGCTLATMVIFTHFR
jgi:hypothetical protein